MSEKATAGRLPDAVKHDCFTIPALKTKLQQMKAANPVLGVVVEGSEEVDYQNLLNVFDVLPQLDITKIGLATEAAGAAR